MFIFRLAFVLATLGLGTLASAAVTFTPQGEAKHVTQVRARFETDMSRVGNEVSPFKVDCGAPGQGRWVTTKDWVYDFDQEVPAGISCRFTLVLTQDVAGNPLKSSSYSFQTGGPQILAIDPQPESGRIDEEQIFVLELDSPVNESSLNDKLYFAVPQIAGKVGFKRLSFDEVKKANKSFAEAFEDRASRILFIQAENRLPSHKTITLVWSPGIESRNGVKSRDKQTFAFTTREGFTATEGCPRAHKSDACSPFDDIFIHFSAEPAADAKAELKGGSPKTTLMREGRSWKIPGPHKAGTQYTITFSKPFKDDAGRELEGDRELKVKVGQYPPLIKFQSKFGILEWRGDPRLPIHIRRVEADVKVRLLKIPLPVGANQNIAAFHQWLMKNESENLNLALLPDGTPGLEFRELPQYKAQGQFEVRGLPLQEPGLYQLELSSADLGKAYAKEEMHVHSQALVTDMVIHWKETPDHQLAWVTSLSSGLPVPEAQITLYNCRLQRVGLGKTNKQGLLFLPKSQTKVQKCASSWKPWDTDGLLITAAKDQDFTFLFNNQTTGIESWRFGLEGDDTWHNPQIHSVLDRSLFRAGETLSVLNVARQRVLGGLKIPKASALPKKVSLTHSGSGKTYPLPLNWDETGRSHFQWAIPVDAPLGRYELQMDNQITGNFSVREFRVATVKAIITPAIKSPLAPRELSYHVHVAYLNGGAANNLNTTARARLVAAAPYRSKAFPDFSFNTLHSHESEGQDEDLKEKDNQLKSVTLKLDAQGEGTVRLPIPELKKRKTLQLELEFPDANGEVRTQILSQTINPANLLLALKADSDEGFRPQKSYRFKGLTLDADEKSVSRDVTVKRFKKTYLTHRRRSIGGTYTYHHKVLLSEETTVCTTRSNAQGEYSCTLGLPESGSFLLRAESKDDQGRFASTEHEVWVEGRQRWYAADDHDRMDLIPDKKTYEAGETAKILVKAPFSKGQMLIATEREGIKSFEVKEFDAKDPYVSIPITREFAPNIYVSVWLVRGRIKGTEPFLEIDLGKPAFKLGILDLKVGRKLHTLDVKVQTEQKTYRPRETAKVTVAVKSPLGALPPGATVTLVAIDEGLLEIEPNPSWDLLNAMMGHRGYQSTNATASMLVVGKRHFGLKALPSGGGGGSDKGSSRELFDTILAWKAIVPLKDGLAQVDIPLNDSLSGFRIVAIAQAGSDLFGQGETQIQSSKELSLFSGLPEVVHNGDRFQARFTVRNASSKTLPLKVSGSFGDSAQLSSKSLSLAPHSSERIEWPVTVPEGLAEIVTTLRAEGPDLSDEITIRQRVVSPLPSQPLLAQIQSLDAEMFVPLSYPPGAQGGTLTVRSDSQLSEQSLGGVRAHAEANPHQGIEQKLSRAVSSNRKDLWTQSKIENHLDKDGLLKFFPNAKQGSVELTAYALELSHYSGWSLPKLTENQMSEGLQLFTQGKIENVGSGLRLSEKLRALAALALFKKDETTASLLKNLDLNPTYLTLNNLIDLRRINQREILDGVLSLANIDRAITERSEFRGSVMQFKTDVWSLLGTSDASLARLILSRLEQDQANADLPTLIRSLLAAQKRAHWDNTASDALATLAVLRFGRKFESVKPSGELTLTLGEITKTLPAKDSWTVNLPWPEGSSRLQLTRSGDSRGQPWITVLASAEVPVRKPEDSGIKLTKSIKKIEGKASESEVGDIYEVSLRISTRTLQEWTSLVDPIPSGSRILPGPTGASYFEPGFEGMKAYFESLSPGEHSFQYRFQLNTAGTFLMPPTRVESMYAPEVFGLIPNEVWTVK